MKKNSFDFEKAEILVRSGDIQAVRDLFQALSLADLERAHYGTFANISWRVGLGEAGLKLLSPLIRDSKLNETTSNRDIAEYANCLTSIGCSHEAITLIKQQPSSPWFSQALAFAYISQWNYNDALTQLNAIRNHEQLPPYSQLVNEVNRIACLVFNGHCEEALELNNSLRVSHRQSLSPRLLGNLRELELQSFLNLNQQQKIYQVLNALPNSPADLDHLLINKWRAVWTALDNPKEGQNLLRTVRKEALHLKRWETVRDVDFQIARIYQNKTFLLRLYFATPHLHYRKMILERFSGEIKIPSSFSFRLLPDDIFDSGNGKRNTTIECEVDLRRGRIGSIQLNPGLVHHRLLLALVSDLYRPHSVGSLFHSLFPEEYYNPHSSPNRVHQAIRGLREALSGSPLGVDEHNGFYRLVTEVLTKLDIPETLNLEERPKTRLSILKEQFPTEFTSKEAATCLECSLKTAQRLINEGIEKGECSKIGQGAKTLFKWTA